MVKTITRCPCERALNVSLAEQRDRVCWRGMAGPLDGSFHQLQTAVSDITNFSHHSLTDPFPTADGPPTHKYPIVIWPKMSRSSDMATRSPPIGGEAKRRDTRIQTKAV